MSAQPMAPTPGIPAASLLTGGDAAGLTVVDGPHWSEVLQKASCGVGDWHVLATPPAGVGVGVVLRVGLHAELLYGFALMLVLVILSSLVVERVRKVDNWGLRPSRG